MVGLFQAIFLLGMPFARAISFFGPHRQAAAADGDRTGPAMDPVKVEPELEPQGALFRKLPVEDPDRSRW